MITYEVEAKVTQKIFNAYVEWLKEEHIREVCSCQGFTTAEILIGKQNDNADTKTVCVLYKVDNLKNLDIYLKEKAPALREKGIDLWGDHLSITRNVWLENSLIN